MAKRLPQDARPGIFAPPDPWEDEGVRGTTSRTDHCSPRPTLRPRVADPWDTPCPVTFGENHV